MSTGWKDKSWAEHERAPLYSYAAIIKLVDRKRDQEGCWKDRATPLRAICSSSQSPQEHALIHEECSIGKIKNHKFRSSQKHRFCTTLGLGEQRTETSFYNEPPNWSCSHSFRRQLPSGHRARRHSLWRPPPSLRWWKLILGSVWIARWERQQHRGQRERTVIMLNLPFGRGSTSWQSVSVTSF